MLINQVQKTITKYNLIRVGDTVVTAVSGGPDSVAMLYSLNDLKDELGFHVHVAHLNHCCVKMRKKMLDLWNL